MKKILILAIVGFICCANECKKPCKDSESEEINFDFVPYGTKAEITDFNTGAIITGQVFSDVKLEVSVWKTYCNGTSKGPFKDRFEITKDGYLNKLSLGTMEYRMDNKLDYMYVSVIAISPGTASLVGGGILLNSLSVYYNELKPYHKGTINLELKVTIKYIVAKKLVADGQITYTLH